jgi:predicted aspartyl protease
MYITNRNKKGSNMRSIFGLLILALALSSASTGHARKAKVAEELTISVDIPMDVRSGRPVILAQIGDGPAVEVEFDTGSSGAVISKAMANQLKLPIVGEAMLRSPFGNEPVKAKLVSLGSLKIGGAAATRLDAIVEENVDFRGPNARLVIGPTMFANHVVTFDYVNGRVMLSPKAPKNITKWRPAGEGGLLETTVDIGGKSYNMHIDSGAPGALTLPRAAYEDLSVKPELKTFAKMRTVDKEFSVDIGTLNLDAVVAGVPVRLGDTLFADIPFANLGSQAMKQFSIVIDNPGKRWALVAPKDKTPVLTAAPLPPRPNAAASPAQTSSEAPPIEVDSRTIAKNLAARLVSDFVYPDQGVRYAAALNANADSGVYDALKGVELASKLSADLQNVAVDGHLRVMFQGMGGGGGPQIIIQRPPEGADGPPPGDRRPVMIRMEPPPAMEQARWIAPGIAFVRFNLFPSEPETVAAARQFMEQHAKAKVIIFDLRTHMGGGLGEMDVIFPRLFAKSTRLLTMATRKSVDEAGMSPISDVPTLRLVEADPDFVSREHWVTPDTDKRLNKAKVYVLTSGFSASAAEHFALALKHTGRATLIGRTTYGANHFGGDQDLGGGFTAFIPVGRAYNPKTGKDWEGTGIAPDIETAPEDALIKALMLSGVPMPKAEQLSAEVAPNGPMTGQNMKKGQQ